MQANTELLEEDFVCVLFLLIYFAFAQLNLYRKCLVDLADLTAPATSADAALPPPSVLPAASATLADAARETRSAIVATASAAVLPSAEQLAAVGAHINHLLIRMY
ncbi:hypothetical protein CDAR_249821 [Caerostris darwini]|uniref:Uncharacterized protein n=1 Tax=Caerostris darwini TaxID=1538125 RepID=A0AAV4UU23_9ARAC|nr:hypothetical protein CDAR_249821 [Caerostris darwini]